MYIALNPFASCVITSPPWHERLARAGLFYATYHWSQGLLKIAPWDFGDPCYQGLLFTVSFFLKIDSWKSKVLTDVLSALLILTFANSRLYIAPSVGPPVLYWETYRQRPLDAVCRDRDIPPSQETNHGRSIHSSFLSVGPLTWIAPYETRIHCHFRCLAIKTPDLKPFSYC